KGANVDKLAAEFADELDTLGVRVANLEKKADAVKITGEVRYHYTDSDDDFNGYETKLRSRLFFNGQINDDWTYTGMIENNQDLKNDAGDEDTKFQRAYVNGKLGGVKVQAGRYNLKLADGNVYDTRFDGVQLSYGKDVKVTAGYGKATPSSVTFKNTGAVGANEFGIRGESDETWYADVTGKVGSLSLGAGYYNFKDVDMYGTKLNTTGNIVSDKALDKAEDFEIWQVNANYAFDKNFKLGAMYLMGDDSGEYEGVDDDGYVVTASYKGAKASQPGSWGLVAKYYDQGVTTYIDHTMNGVADKMFGFKGYSVFANYTFAKNIVGQVEWYDLEEKEGERESQTLWAQMLFTF
ncbi:hypothetical protein, partial [uncultured Phascolarctobacterium sp.]|uniref:hypothetical protein n=1 Tax=uncultured Phascolarctobacterium sp. TaxID=512296 RepID=UPI0025E490D7